MRHHFNPRHSSSFRAGPPSDGMHFRGGRPGHGHGGPGGHGGRGGHGPRVFHHGALRLVVLALIAEAPRHGYEIIKAIEERLAGSYSPSPVGSSRVDLQACKLEYSIVSPK